MLSWSSVARHAASFPAARPSRYVPAVVVATIGVGLTILTWMRALEERQLGVSNVLGSLADETSGGIEAQLDREVNALRGIATFWQLQGATADRSWYQLARMTMEHFPGIQWIAWVRADPARTRFLSREEGIRADPGVLDLARSQRTTPAALIQESWGEAYDLRVFLPVGSPRESVGVLAAMIRVDSLWLKKRSFTGSLSVKLTSDKGKELVLRAAATEAPRWAKLRRMFTSPSGNAVQVELVPRPEILQPLTTPWPHYFLITGLLLSLAVAVLSFQFLRTRDFSAILTRANHDLDLRIGQLSRRDQELKMLNEVLEQRVGARTAELTDALREIETFSHSVSHDLRSPIGAILNFAAVLEEDYGSHLDEEGRRLLERIRAAGLRANQLLNGLVEFAATGAYVHEPAVLDMKAIADGGVAEVIGQEGDARDVRFTVGDLPPAFADPVQVHRVFVNLIGNAIKYSRGRSARTVEVRGNGNAAEATYWVRDNGPGFDPSRAPEVFEPFRRLQGANVEGDGLGLAIVAKLVRRQGGRVWAESDGKSGATFYFTLPSAGRRNDEGSGGPARR